MNNWDTWYLRVDLIIEEMYLSEFLFPVLAFSMDWTTIQIDTSKKISQKLNFQSAQIQMEPKVELHLALQQSL